ncbi:alpha/beta fold hydrolase [Micromonospora peucetia]|uniref:Alpha/beta fold hydrolase n=1 Tax=Micromonospora peucetia TaxID=47871 RepID=A0A1C6UK85_9ACTN|nr:alpha/beta fold hydrolase [Micromonospora peucetia]WSA34228.1 alpha/beta fold hydrolase [Micromonospora peucetia]SCL54480.1 Thioesterase domain-containing protein [Micromonospora peucetia]
MTTRLPGRLVPLLRRGVRPACVLLPGAGGGLHPYLRLAAAIGKTHNVAAVRAAGLLPDEEPELSIAEMADAALRALDEDGTVPAAVLGWSLGGSVAWELCVRLAERGHLPDLVLVDASPLPRRATADEDARVRETVVGMLGPRPDPATVERVRRVFDTQVAAFADYRADRPYAGRVLMLTCTDEEFEFRAEASTRWRELAPDLRAGRLDAGHFDVFDPDRLPQLVDEVTPFLGRASGAVLR